MKDVLLGLKKTIEKSLIVNTSTSVLGIPIVIAFCLELITYVMGKLKITFGMDPLVFIMDAFLYLIVFLGIFLVTSLLLLAVLESTVNLAQKISSSLEKS
jgi:hypothetical protein